MLGVLEIQTYFYMNLGEPFMLKFQASEDNGSDVWVAW
jgi:hypothetical protein